MKEIIAIVVLSGVFISMIAYYEPSPEDKWINYEERRETGLCKLDARYAWQKLEHEHKWSEEGKESFRQEMRECK